MNKRDIETGFDDSQTSCRGAKLALFAGEALVVILRDDKSDIPYPAHWDFPGGGRDEGESPLDCVLRETREELGLRLEAAQISYGRCYAAPSGLSWFFAAHFPASIVAQVQLGDEGQRWELMLPEVYLAHPLGIGIFQNRLQRYLQGANRLT